VIGDASLERFFPYDALRPGQLELARRVYAALTQREHLIVQAPTGFGKTGSLLAASLLAIEKVGLAIHYVVRTHREAEVGVRELKRIENRAPFPFVAVEMRGRKHLCALDSLAGADSELASKLCRAMASNRRCRFFNRTGLDRAATEGQGRYGIWDFAWASEIGRARGMCPYFMLKDRAVAADLVISPYQYVMFEQLRRGIIGNSRRPRALVIDECVAEGSMVRTPTGEQTVEEVQDGSSVLSVFPGVRHNPTIRADRVLGKRSYLSKVVFEIRTEGDLRAEVTGNTRLLVLKAGKSRWIRTDELRSGDIVWSTTSAQAEPRTIEGIRRVGPRTVYDFVTSPDHNYVAGGLVVHNSHNLPSMMGTLASNRLKVIELEEALLETVLLRSPLSGFIGRLLRSLKAARHTTATVIERKDFLRLVEEALGGADPAAAIGAIRTASERFQARIIARGGIHESALSHFLSFLRCVVQASPDGILQYVPRDRFSEDRLEFSWWDPERCQRMFRSFQSTVHASGTNGWPEAYAALVGLSGAYSTAIAPFNPGPKNCFVGVLANLTTQEDFRTTENYERNSLILADIVNSLRGKTALFVTSFDVLNQLRSAGLKSMILAATYWEAEDMDSCQHEALLRQFSSNQEEGVLAGVMGGRSGEGVDFGAGVLNNSIVFGVPFPEPSPIMRRYEEWLNRRFPGKGSDYAYVYPATVKAAQALGRAPRSLQDRVVCVLADRRFAEPRLLNRFPEWIRENCRGTYLEQARLVEDVERFYSAGRDST